ncbi:MAG: amino acid carrier protein [Acetivibrio sp.]
MLDFFKNINHVLWGFPIIILLLFTHLYFTFRLHFVQKYTFRGIKLSVTPENSSEKGFSSFGALSTTLAATLGTGNIIGVSTAVVLGGPGAIFWCWITGILGMATTYGECYLSLLFRRKGIKGTYYGGPMYVLEHGLHKKGLAVLYAFCVICASFGVGCTTQSNSMADTLLYLWKIPPQVTGIVVSLFVGFVLIKGFSSIEKWCMKLVPFMSFLFLGASFLILVINASFILPGLLLIIRSAFSSSAVSGGVLGGALRYGIARGLFTNEAGLGSAAIAAAASNTQDIKRQALISATATFWDTVVMCAITGIVIVTNLLRNPISIQGRNMGGLTHAAFEVLPFGSFLLGICLLLFAFATLLGWSYFGQQAFLYLFQKKHLKIYQTAYMVFIFLGAVLSLDLVWEITDTLNIFMAVPNLISLYCLRKLLKSP